MLSQFLIVALFAWAGIKAVIGMLVGLLLVQAFVFMFFGIETRNLSLEEIGRIGADRHSPLGAALEGHVQDH